MADDVNMVRVRACCTLPGLRFGEAILADGGDPYIAGLIEGGLLLLLNDAAAPDRADETSPGDAEAASDDP